MKGNPAPLTLCGALLLTASVSPIQPPAAGPLAPVGLRCEYLTDPLGIDTTSPRLFWTPQHAGRGIVQAAYQVVVSIHPEAQAGDQWDSGRVASGEFTQVVYTGKPLESARTYYWKVRYWDHNGQGSPYSATARFETGLLAAADWKARWIRGGNQLRKEFSLPSKPVRARTYVSGLGYYELRLNGHKVGNHVLDPAWTTYSKRVLYATYDVTGQLNEGPNAVGIMLGQGRFGARAALVQLDIELAGGRRVQVVTDASWKGTEGAIVADSIYNGETYDARRWQPGWDRPGFNDAAWGAVSLKDPPTGVLSAQMMPPIRVVGDLVPLTMTNPRPGVYVFDFGQNFSGWTRLRVTGPAGATVRLRHAELLYDDGTVNVESLGAARATDTYILRGGGDEEVYEPRFTYHGFRYVEVTGYPGTPLLNSLLGRVVHTDVKQVGGFSASKPILNQLQRIILWSTKTNLHSIPTDSDQRAERLGWMADAHLVAETAMLNFDMAAFYTNFLRDIRDDQQDGGLVPNAVPDTGLVRPPTDPAWGAAYPLIVLYMYERYGDRRILEEHFDGIRKWAEYLRSTSESNISTVDRFGDWVAIERTPGDLVSTCFYYWSVDIVARAAAVLGKTADAERYGRLAADIRDAFHKKFYNEDAGSYGNGTQTANTLPLYLGMVPVPTDSQVAAAANAGMAPVRARQAVQARVFNTLRLDVLYGHDTHLTTGILGAKYVMPVLTRMGRPDLAYDLATQTTYPSWGFMIERGATTLWEIWQHKTGSGMNSQNHPMFGSVGTWLYEALAGINVDGTQPAYRRIRIEPQVVHDLEFASGSIDTVRGRVASAWSRSAESLRMEVTIPVGSTAQVVVPKGRLEDVSIEEGGRVVWRGGAFRPGVPGVAGGQETNRAVVFEVGSGTYVFERKG